MSEIGRSAVFYATYGPEMDRLYGSSDDSLLDCLPQSERAVVRMMVNFIGKSACVEGGEFLGSMVSDCEIGLRNTCVPKRCKDEKFISKYWKFWFELRPNGRNSSSRARHWAGVVWDYNDKDNGHPLVCWLQVEGKARTERLCRELELRKDLIEPSRRLKVCNSVVVVIKTVPTGADTNKDFIIRAKPLKKACVEAFKEIPQDVMNRILAI